MYAMPDIAAPTVIGTTGPEANIGCGFKLNQSLSFSKGIFRDGEAALAHCHSPVYNTCARWCSASSETAEEGLDMTRTSRPTILDIPMVSRMFCRMQSQSMGATRLEAGEARAEACPLMLHTDPMTVRLPIAAGTRVRESASFVTNVVLEFSCRQLSIAAGCILYPLPLIL